MSKLKTLFLSALSLLAVVFLVACQSTQTSHLQMFEDDNFDNRITFHHQGDKMVKQETKNLVLYKTLGVKDADEAKEAVEAMMPGDIYKDLKGFTRKVDYQEDRFVETITIDYSKVDFDQAANTLGAAKTEDGKGISYKKLFDSFTSLGYKEVKDGKFQEFGK